MALGHIKLTRNDLDNDKTYDGTYVFVDHIKAIDSFGENGCLIVLHDAEDDISVAETYEEIMAKIESDMIEFGAGEDCRPQRKGKR